MFRLPLLALVVLYLFVPSAAALSAQKDSPELATAPESVRKALLAEDWARAISELDKFISANPESDDHWMLLRAIAQRGAGQLDEAEVSLTELERKHPESAWIFKSRFLRADLYREASRFEEAVRIYEEAAQRLRSEERQSELAQIYFDFADSLSADLNPSRPDEGNRDLDRAAVLYSKVLDLEVPSSLRERATYRAAWCLRKLGRWQDAMARCKSYLREFGSQGTADNATWARLDRESEGRVFLAQQELAECENKSGHTTRGRRRLEDLAAVLRDYRTGAGGLGELAGSDEWAAERSSAVRDLEAETLFVAARTYGGSSSERLLAIAALERLLDGLPDWNRAFEARFEIASQYHSMGRNDDALAAFDAVLTSSATTASDSEVRERDSTYRQRSLFLKGEILRRQRKYTQAIEVYNDYIARNPTGPDWAAAQQAILECEYSVGALHREEKRYAEARAAWTTFLDSHPLDHRSRQILFSLGELYALEAEDQEDPEAEQTRSLWLAAIDEWKRVVSKYAGSNDASQALCRIGLTYETKLAMFEEAIAAYRSCNFGNHHATCLERLNEMTEETLSVRTERTWRTNEKPKIHLTSRNVESVQIELYAIDLEAYFRKHLTHRRIEDLDLDLIATDQEFEHSITDYRRYALTERDVELPVEGPGVWAVVVVAEDQRATTLVLQSDIEIIVKSSRSEFFAFAQDMLKDEAAQGVRVLIGGAGQSTMHELVTGEDGVARETFDELDEMNSMHVFAVHEGHIAANGLSIEGLQVPDGIRPRGVAYTDRSAYRPGQTVRWRAILRNVEDGAYSFVQGTEYKVEIVDSSGRLLTRTRVPMSEFGTLSGEIQLDEFAPLGNYTLLCTNDQRASASCHFAVEEYQLQTVELTFDVERDVYFRGEVVRVGIDADYYYGAPVANSPIQVWLPDGRTFETSTDENGHADVEFETRDFVNRGRLEFSATLVNEQVTSSGSIYLSLLGYRTSVSTVRSVFLAGSSFNVDVETQSPGGDALSRDVELTVLRIEPGPFCTKQQVVVSKQDMTTDSSSGLASVPVRIDKGGDYVLRVEGLDRFRNRVSARKQIYISGDQDPAGLRFLSDARRWNVGDNATLQLHSKGSEGLALITFEGQDVIDYRIKRLTRGSNALEFVVDHPHFPNFAVTAAMMHGNEFQTAEVLFDVDRKLVVTVEPARDSYAPGERARATVRVTDQLGRPVRAELSLGVVDAALLDLFPDLTPRIASVFDAGTRRNARMRTMSSCEFAYEGVTREISRAILDEQFRAQEEARWATERGAALSQLQSLDKSGFGRVGLVEAEEVDLDAEVDFFADSLDTIAIGGGGGGSFGGRSGGRKSKRAHPGRGRSQGPSGVRGLEVDTAYWIADLVTDERGEAHVEFTVPEKSTRWQLTCRGVGKDTLLGEVETTLVSKSEFFVELQAPVGLTEGDRAQFSARVHNLTERAGECTVNLALTTEENGPLRSLSKKIQLDGESIVEVLFDMSEALPYSRGLSVTCAADFGENSDEDARLVRVRPWGVERVATRSGTLESRVVLELELPGGRKYGDKELELFLGASLDQLVIDAALGEVWNRHWGARSSKIISQADAASELAGVCAVLEFLSKSGRPGNATYRDLSARATALTARLAGSQNGDGSWNWIGRRGLASVETSSRAVYALSQAKKRGITMDANVLARGVEYLQGAFRAAPQDADEFKAMLMYGLAASDSGDFAALNRLHRNRHRLSTAALAYTTLALVEMERVPMAKEVALVLQEKAEFEAGSNRSCRWPTVDNTAWNQSELGTAALAILALQRALPSSTAIDAGVEFLLSQRPWSPTGPRGAIVEALSNFAGVTQPLRDNLRVTASIDGQDHAVALAAGKPSETIRVALPEDHEGKVRVELALEGRGRPHFAAALRGFDSVINEVETKAPGLSIRKYRFLTVAPTYEGRAVPTGFGVTRRFRDTWRNEVANLPVGDRTRVEIDYYLHSEERVGRGRDYLVLEAPLPAGARVLEKTVAGSFQSFDVRDGLLTVFLGSRAGSGTISFELLGANPGEYRVLPARVSSATDPGRYGLSKVQNLSVLPTDATSPDKYRATPDELFHLGKAMFENEDFDQSHARLSALFEQFETTLRPSELKAVANMMLHMSIERSDSNAIVRYFEVLKEKDPSVTIAFEDVLRVAEAYNELREFERALLIYRAVVEETHGKDLKVAGTLEEQGEFAGATDALQRLWLEYPDFPAALRTQLALADMLLTKAPDASKDESLRKAGRTRATVTLQGILMLKRFLSMYPQSPLAPEAGLNLVSAYLGLEDYETAAELSGEMAALYEDPKFTDAFLYTQAVAEWYLGQDNEARDRLQRIAEAMYPNEDGGSEPSENKHLALYILGQIFHAQKDLDKAAEYYDEVSNLFVDAKEALDDFRERALTLEEVTTTRPGQPVSLALEYKNLDEVELLVYSVDLMTLYLREQNLANITEVNLAGISPTLRKTVNLSETVNARQTEQSVALELEEAGAYLVICRGAELFSSGLVLVSNLELEVKEDPAAGRLRVQVLDLETGDYLRDVDVRVVGSYDGAFQSGKTDPRGLFIADNVLGHSTAIARLGSRHFAFHRGEVNLGGAPVPEPTTGLSAPQEDQAGTPVLRDSIRYFDNVIGFNRANNDLRQEQLDNEISKGRAGVQVQQVK